MIVRLRCVFHLFYPLHNHNYAIAVYPILSYRKEIFMFLNDLIMQDPFYFERLLRNDNNNYNDEYLDAYKFEDVDWEQLNGEL